ncbi:MAG: right-handed parallel beta-helix repeat-containing protein, partial [Planctomycetota bacterium]
MKYLISICIFVILAGLVQADTMTVGPGPGYDYNTIQAGIDAAGEGDAVIVAEGTYYENIQFNETNITLRSTDPNDSAVVEQTIIDGGGLGPVVTFPYRKNANTELAGFTITGGSFGAGGGILGWGTKATVSRCIISGNFAAGDGGGLAGCLGTISHCIISDNVAGYKGGGLQYCNGLITHCIISGNTTRSGGSGLDHCGGEISNCIISGNSSSSYGAGVWDCGGVISNCIISNNSSGGDYGAGGIHCSYDCSPTISGCLITSNTGGYGGGINCDRSSPTITNCTIAGNTTIRYAGGIYSSYGGNPIVTNSIFWGNSCSEIRGPVTVSYSNIRGGWPGQGNIDADPLFALGTDYHIMPGSPCIDAGDPNYIPDPNETDLDGNPRALDGDGDGNNVVDMGAYEYNPGCPFITVSADEFYFVQDWPKRKPQTLLIRNCGGQPLHWEITEDSNWLEVTPANGISINQINEVTITVDPNGLAPGLYRYSFEVKDPNAFNSPVTINITMPVGEILHVSDEFATIQAAIDDANDYDIVLVADGNYTGEGNRDIDFLGKAITVKSENGPNNCIIDCNGIYYYELHRGFYFHSGETANSVVDGFTITNGYTSWYQDGGAINCTQSSPTIKNCIISGNEGRRGGGIYYGYKSSWPLPQEYYIVSATVTNCTISNNIGGGIYCDAKGMLTITNCTISGNTSYLLDGEWGYEGGGIACFKSSATITNCTLTGNSTKSHYGGGGISYGGPHLTISNCVINDNIDEESVLSEGGGGGIRSFGQTTIANCNISGNLSRSLWGGGGGGIYYRGRTTITNCNISGNSANEGGGIYSDGSTTLTNCTITGNLADGGGGGIHNHSRPKLIVTNCILWGNSEPEIKYFFDGAVRYSDIKGGWPGIGNIDLDPCFVEPGYWADANDANAVWIEGNYHLLRTSPCVDAANDANVYTDIEGNPRPF